MADRLRFHPQVASDLRAATQWYGRIARELANRFRMLVNDRFDAVAARPQAFGLAFDNVRFARVQRFPYLVLFREAGDWLQVLGVFHTASDQAKWRRRAVDR